MTEGPPGDPMEYLKGLAEHARRVRLAPGVVGKTSNGLIGLFILWGIILWRLPAEIGWTSGLMVGAGCLATYVFWSWANRMETFARDNPALALMEGADITEYKKFEAQAKGQSAIASTPPISDPSAPPLKEIPPSSWGN